MTPLRQRFLDDLQLRNYRPRTVQTYLQHIVRFARHFHKSKDHLSLYFKKQTGITIKEYITEYKMRLVRTRLLYSDLTIAAIAAELDFTDESHLNKVFRRKYAMTATAYRKMYKSCR